MAAAGVMTRGPLADISPKFSSMTVEEQIVDAMKRLADFKANYLVDLEKEYRIKLVNAQAWGEMAAAKAQEAEKQLNLRQDPRYLVLHEKAARMSQLLKEEPALDEPVCPKEQFRANFREALQSLVKRLPMVPNAAGLDRMLSETYCWFRRQEEVEASGPSDSSVFAQKDANLPCFHILQPEDMAADHTMPGSAFWAPPSTNDPDDLEAGESHTHATLPSATSVDIPPQPPLPSLPPAHERLQQFVTKQVATPLTGPRVAKLASLRSACASPDFVDRPFTPSTATGGVTSRSMTPSTARSTPSPVPLTPSRPTSAASGYQRPLTARSMRSQPGYLPPRPGTSTGFSDNGPIPEGTAGTPSSSSKTWPRMRAPVPGTEVKEPPTEAELRMEERWLQYRHREIADQIIAEERRAVVRDWAERRARVEEEIARNIEASRYQSELRRRGYRVPEDADEDIAAYVPAGSAAAAAAWASRVSVVDASRPDRAGVTSATAASLAWRRSKAGAKETPRFDVTKVDRTAGRGGVRFQWDNTGPGSKTAKVPKPPASQRSAYLRTLHRKLLEPREEGSPSGHAAGEKEDKEEEEDADDDDAGSEASDRPGERRISLSPYAPDDSDDESEREGCGPPVGGGRVALRREDDTDVLATLCKSWWRQFGGVNPAVVAVGMDEMRFKQLQEVEEIKRVFARCNRPMEATVLERAMVMPVHRATGVGIFGKGSSNLPSNPFYKATAKKKKKGKVKAKKSAKGGKKKAR